MAISISTKYSLWLQYDQSDEDSVLLLAEEPLPVFKNLEEEESVCEAPEQQSDQTEEIEIEEEEESKQMSPMPPISNASKPTKPPIPSNNKYSNARRSTFKEVCMNKQKIIDHEDDYKHDEEEDYSQYDRSDVCITPTKYPPKRRWFGSNNNNNSNWGKYQDYHYADDENYYRAKRERYENEKRVRGE